MKKLFYIFFVILLAFNALGADTKLSDLTELATTPASSDEFYINDGGTSKKIQYSNVLGNSAQAAAVIGAGTVLIGDDGVRGVKEGNWTNDASGHWVPDAGTQTIGTTANPVENLWFLDDDDFLVSVLSLAIGQQAIRNNTSILSFSTGYAVSGSVWTYTITDTSGLGRFTFVIGGKVMQEVAATMDVVLTSYAGTDTNPNLVYVYVQNDGGDEPELVGSNTSPDVAPVDHVHVATILAGTISASSMTNYGNAEDNVTSDEIVNNVYHEVFSRGAQYVSGMTQTVTSSNATIGVGVLRSIFDDKSTVEVVAGTDGMIYQKNDGTFATDTTFTFADEYSDGTAIAVNRYFNVVLGVLPCDGTTCMLAVVQTGAFGEYTTLAGAQVDNLNAIRYFPVNALQASLFVPVARIVVQNTGTGVLQQFANLEYFEDLRTAAFGGGGGGTAVSGVAVTGTPTVGQIAEWTDATTVQGVSDIVIDSLDGNGAVDIDYGSADITDHTFISDGGTAIIDGSYQFPDADSSPSVVGELEYDNTVTGFIDGLMCWYDDDAVRYVVDTPTLPTVQGELLEYNATADQWEPTSTLNLAFSASVPEMLLRDTDAAGADPADEDAGSIKANMSTTTEDAEVSDMFLTAFGAATAGTEYTWMWFDSSDAAAYIGVMTDSTTPADVAGYEKIKIDGNTANDGEALISNPDGYITINHTSIETDFIPIVYANDGTSAPATAALVTSTNSAMCRAFDGASNEDVKILWRVPDDIDTSAGIKFAVTCYVGSATAPANTEVVAFSLAGVSFGNSDIMSGAVGTAQTSSLTADATYVQYDKLETAFSSVITVTNLTAGETAHLDLIRLAATTDTYAQDIHPAGIVIKYKGLNNATF